MKTITSNLLKGLLVIVLFTGVSVVLSATGVQTVSVANATVNGNTPKKQTELTSAAKVSDFLSNKGYEVISVKRIGRSNNWTAVIINSHGEQAQILVNTNMSPNSNSNSNQILSTQEGAL